MLADSTLGDCRPQSVFSLVKTPSPTYSPSCDSWLTCSTTVFVGNRWVYMLLRRLQTECITLKQNRCPFSERRVLGHPLGGMQRSTRMSAVPVTATWVLVAARTSQRGDWGGSSTTGCKRCIYGTSQRLPYGPKTFKVGDYTGVIWIRKGHIKPSGCSARYRNIAFLECFRV